MTPRALILIPARLAATRLPNKPLADIAGAPMIVHVWRAAQRSGIGPVIVAAAEQEIVDAVVRAGGDGVLTDPDLPSGSDRVRAAAERYDPGRRYDIVVNVQGDLATLDPDVVARTLDPLADPAVAIATPVAGLAPGEFENPNVVKALVPRFDDAGIGRAETFTRTPDPARRGVCYHHLGLYAFRRDALDRFVSLPPSANETRERLEQLRAMDDGMRIDVVRVSSTPFGVDTPADLDRARKIIAARGATG